MVEEAEARAGDLVGVFLGVRFFPGDLAATSLRDAIASTDLPPVLGVVGRRESKMGVWGREGKRRGVG